MKTSVRKNRIEIGFEMRASYPLFLSGLSSFLLFGLAVIGTRFHPGTKIRENCGNLLKERIELMEEIAVESQ